MSSDEAALLEHFRLRKTRERVGRCAGWVFDEYDLAAVAIEQRQGLDARRLLVRVCTVERGRDDDVGMDRGDDACVEVVPHLSATLRGDVVIRAPGWRRQVRALHVEVLLPGAEPSGRDVQRQVVLNRNVGEGRDEHRGVTVAHQQDRRTSPADDQAVRDRFPEAVHGPVAGAGRLPVESGWDGGEAAGGGAVDDGFGGLGGVGDFGDEDEGGDDADGEAGGDDDAAVAVEEGADADGSFEDFVAEGCERGGDDAGDGDGGDDAEVELFGDEEDDEPVPEVGAVGDFAEVDDGAAGQEAFGEAAGCGFDRDDDHAGGEGDGDAAFDGVEVHE